MRLKCDHGFFTFEETDAGQIADFCNWSGLSVVPIGPRFTFEALENTPKYSLEGAPLLNFTATATHEGTEAEVFEANGVIYNFSTRKLEAITSVTEKFKISLVGNYFVAGGLIIPGSMNQKAQRVKSYSAWWSQRLLNWLYSEVTYV